jgi:23S rRNA (guanosine2251-2'-O)-methyltransferase
MIVSQRNSKSNRPRPPTAGGYRNNAKGRPEPIPKRPTESSEGAKSRVSEQSDRGHRREGHAKDQTWLWGRHAVLAALANDLRKIRRFLVAKSEEADLPTDLPIRPELVEREVIFKLLPSSAVHQGYALLIRAEGQERAIVLALDQVTDPQNVGAILRSAAALGAMGVIMTEAHAPPSDGVLAKAASGALERIPLGRVPNLVGAFEKLKAEGFWIAGLEAEAPKTLAEAGLSGRIVLVLGAEGAGLRRLTRERCDWLVQIPLSGVIESLNVSAAAACALYELARLGIPPAR